MDRETFLQGLKNRRATDADPLADIRARLKEKEQAIDRCSGMIAELQSKMMRLVTEAAMLREKLKQGDQTNVDREGK